MKAKVRNGFRRIRRSKPGLESSFQALKAALYAPDLAAGEPGRVSLDSGDFGAPPLERREKHRKNNE
jgi:hypothetical protein